MAEKKKKSVVLALIAVVLLAAAGSAWFLWNRYQTFLRTPLKLPAEGAVVEVTEGETAVKLARHLQERGMISDARFLRFHLHLHPELGRIQAGEYQLQPGITAEGLLALLTSGKVRLHGITFPEGWTFRQWRLALDSTSVLEHRTTGLSDQEVMERLGHAGEHPEGRFFPDTYLFPKGFSDLELLRRAYQRMEKELASAWAGRDRELPLGSPYEALILASIVEKETARPEERPVIAGVFIRRLRKGMKLQTDPTVIYGIGDRFDGNIRRSDLRRDTPYNTYVHAGLPPTPICMPGRESLLAAVHPAQGKALYFVARGDGSHQFSRSLKEHNRAVRKYQLKKR